MNLSKATNAELMQVRGIMFNVQRFSVHDGPGIRTTVFLKGCPLRCFWCCNPESQTARMELSYSATDCAVKQGCGNCVEVCRNGAISLEEGEIRRHASACVACFRCVSVCPTQSLEIVGKQVTAGDILKAVQDDAPFYRFEEGGMTFSGGEALAQPDFVEAVCRLIRQEGISTAVETCAHLPYEFLARTIPLLDYVMIDVKHIDSDAHRRGTGVGNELILENIRRLRADFPHMDLTLRTPVIPGFNDSEEAVAGMAAFAGSLPNVRYELLPYHRLGESKYVKLGRDYSFQDISSPSAERMARLRGVASRYVQVVTNNL